MSTPAVKLVGSLFTHGANTKRTCDALRSIGLKFRNDKIYAIEDAYQKSADTEHTSQQEYLNEAYRGYDDLDAGIDTSFAQIRNSDWAQTSGKNSNFFPVCVMK